MKTMKKIYLILGLLLFITSNKIAISQPITIGTLSKTTYCGGEVISISFTVTGTFTAWNIFTAELSNATDIFTSPYIIWT